MIDLHVHTNHSCDSKVTIEQYCEKAIELGLMHICFTDHIDFNKADCGYGYYNVNKFPDMEFLNIYQNAGGEKVAIGSDAHSIEELAQGYDYASNLIAAKFKNVVYINRKPQILH